MVNRLVVGRNRQAAETIFHINTHSPAVQQSSHAYNQAAYNNPGAPATLPAPSALPIFTSPSPSLQQLAGNAQQSSQLQLTLGEDVIEEDKDENEDKKSATSSSDEEENAKKRMG